MAMWFIKSEKRCKIAAIAPERRKLDWLMKPDQPPLLLQEKHLQEFLTYFEDKSEGSRRVWGGWGVWGDGKIEVIDMLVHCHYVC